MLVRSYRYHNTGSQKSRQDGCQQMMPNFVNRKDATQLRRVTLLSAEQLEVFLTIGHCQVCEHHHAGIVSDLYHCCHGERKRGISVGEEFT